MCQGPAKLMSPKVLCPPANTQPAAHMSTAGPYALAPNSSSGGRYHRVNTCAFGVISHANAQGFTLGPPPHAGQRLQVTELGSEPSMPLGQQQAVKMRCGLCVQMLCSCREEGAPRTCAVYRPPSGVPKARARPKSPSFIWPGVNNALG